MYDYQSGTKKKNNKKTRKWVVTRLTNIRCEAFDWYTRAQTNRNGRKIETIFSAMKYDLISKLHAVASQWNARKSEEDAKHDY